MKLYDAVSEAIDNKKFCVGIFIDLSKAFDTLNHDILLEKLFAYGVRGTPHNLIKSYLENRKQCIDFLGYKSSLLPTKLGVPQGSILGPLLSILYFNDLLNMSKILKFILFADDTNLFYSNNDLEQLLNIVNHELNILSDWFKANRLSLNVKKTNFILFGNKSKKLGCKDINFEPTLKVNDEKLMRVTETKFLGVIVDQNLNWRSHIDFIALKISRSLAILSKLKHLLSNKILLTLYYTLIFPHLSYS